jgi:hypothetical protein
MSHEFQLERNLEIEEPGQTHRFSQDELRDTPEHQREPETKVPEFEPLILATFSAEIGPPEKPLRGLCGRDSHGKPIVPEGAFVEIMTGADMRDSRIQEFLKQHNLETWPMFETSDPSTQSKTWH